MSNQKPLHALIDGQLVFFQEFLKHPLQIGSVISSSRFLESRIVETAGVSSARSIVELGPGTGGTTRAILKAMPHRSTLLTIENNIHLHNLVRCINDNRLISHLGNANGLKKILAMYGLDTPEVLISGIPFSTMSHVSGSQIIEMISSVLAPGGRFVAYQLSKRVACLCQPTLGSAHMEVELFNIPPLRVYRWEKSRTEK
jgi:phospholipid N-methyltransferase